MEDDPNSTSENPPIWAKALGVIVLIVLVGFAATILVGLAIRLVEWVF